MSGGTSFEQIKAYLLESNAEGQSLYDHLASVVLRLAEEKPKDALGKFEQLSMQVKQETFKPSGGHFKSQPSEFETKAAKVRKDVEILFKGKPPVLDEDGNPIEVELNTEYTIPNVVEQGNLFEQIGVGLSKSETYRVQVALRRLAEQNPLKSVKLWGKIYGTQQDYVIAEAEFKEGEHPEEKEEPPAEEEEEGGEAKPKPESKEVREGTNRLVYFVCNLAGEGGGAWSLLPEVYPKQIIAARLIKKFFTGNLDAEVVSYPPFPGKEREYLRAQIARIAHATAVSPKGLIALPGEDPDEENPVEPYEQKNSYEKLELEDLANLENWVHHYQAILQTAARSIPEKKEEEEGAEEAEDEEVETGPEMGTAVSSDDTIQGVAAWSLIQYNKYNPQFPIVSVRSNRWPGAFAYGAEGGAKSATIYIGWGQKFTGTAYSPPLPAPLASDVATGAAEIQDPTADEEAEFDRLDEEARRAAEEAARLEAEENAEEPEE